MLDELSQWFECRRYVPNEFRAGMISLSLAPANAAILCVLIQVNVLISTESCFWHQVTDTFANWINVVLCFNLWFPVFDIHSSHAVTLTVQFKKLKFVSRCLVDYSFHKLGTLLFSYWLHLFQLGVLSMEFTNKYFLKLRGFPICWTHSVGSLSMQLAVRDVWHYEYRVLW